MKRILSSFVVVLMLFGMFPAISASAEWYTEDGWYYTITEGEVTIVGGGSVDDAGKLEIPEMLSGYPVTSIGNAAFHEREELISVILPNGLKIIEESAFGMCYNLAMIDIPNSVCEIGAGAFDKCIALRAVNIPDGVTIIEDFVFQNSGLNYICLPNGVHTIGDGAFACTYSLSYIVLPKSVTTIEDGSFSFSNLTDVWYAGSSSEKESISGHDEMPDSVTWQYNCCSAEMHTYDDAYDVDCNTCGTPRGSFGTTGNCTWSLINTVLTIRGNGTMGDYASQDRWSDYWSPTSTPWGTAITEIVVEDGVSYIGKGAFANCKSLTSVTIPNSVESIGASAFFDCNNLQNVYISDLASWCRISFHSYWSGSAVATNEYSEANPLYYADYLYLNNELIRELVIPEDVTEIPIYGFSCKNITSVVVPGTVETIGDQAFLNCTSLTSLTICEGVKEINGGAFWNCEGLTVVDIPDSVTYIGGKVFYGCKNLSELTIPYTDMSNGFVVLFGGYSLESYFWEDEDIFQEIPVSLKKVTVTKAIYKNAFRNCAGLEEIIIEEGVTVIGEAAFAGCTGLTSITIPEGVTSIEAYAFYEVGGGVNVCYLGSQESARLIDIQHGNGGLSWHYNCCQENHIYSYVCTAYCDICGHSRIAEAHTYSNACDKECNLCHAIRSGGDHKYQNACDVTCEICQEPRVVGPHQYYNDCDRDCNACGFVRAITHTYSNDCDTVCNICKASRTVGPHKYNDSCDTSCNICGVTRSITHTYTNTCDNTCNVCSAVRHIAHTFGEYVYNEDATASKDGTKTRTCRICGYIENFTAPGTMLKNPFNDVAKGQYYTDPVLWAVSKGITTGTAANAFSPEEACTRGQIVTFLWRAAGKPEPNSGRNPFVDVSSDQYYYKAVLWAVENGITTGASVTTFEPESSCTRGQIVTFLYRAKGKPAAGSSNPFWDISGSAYYYSPVLWAVKNGITTGTSANTFEPEASCTRAQIVTFLYRAYK